MKRLFVILALGAIAIISITGFELFGNYSFYHVHISDKIESHCATVSKWYNNSNGLEVNTEEYGSMFLSEGTYQLFENAEKCPYCAE